MLTPLGDALTGWRPRSGAPDDPLATIRAAWTDLVGTDIARAAQPVALTGSALVVITASSAWSHQLSFLERTILAGIASLGVPGVERLRFRLGTVRPPVRGGLRRTVERGAERFAIANRPASVDDALARLRTVIERRRAAHAARGGAFCSICRAVVDPGQTACRPCRDAAADERRTQCERVLFQAPWLDVESVLAAVPGLDATEYDTYRRALLRRWIDELRLARRRFEAKAPIDATRIRKLASSYVLLETRVDPNRLELDSPIRQNALGDLYAFIRAVEAVR